MIDPPWPWIDGSGPENAVARKRFENHAEQLNVAREKSHGETGVKDVVDGEREGVRRRGRRRNGGAEETKDGEGRS